MPAAAGVAIAAWTGGAITAAVATTVVTGVIVGAVIGAATALIGGGDLSDVFQGALIGGAIGGVTAGVFSYASGAAAGTSAGATAPVADAAVQTELAAAGYEGLGTTVADTTTGGALEVAATTTPAASTMSDATANLYSGLAEGISTGLGEIGAAKVSASAAEDAAVAAAQIKAEEKEANTPGDYTAQTGNIDVSNWWDKYTDISVAIDKYTTPTNGLLAG